MSTVVPTGICWPALSVLKPFLPLSLDLDGPAHGEDVHLLARDGRRGRLAEALDDDDPVRAAEGGEQVVAGDRVDERALRAVEPGDHRAARRDDRVAVGVDRVGGDLVGAVLGDDQARLGELGRAARDVDEALRAARQSRRRDLLRADEVVRAGAVRSDGRVVPGAAAVARELEPPRAREAGRDEEQRGQRALDPERRERDDLVGDRAARLGLAELVVGPAREEQHVARAVDHAAVVVRGVGRPRRGADEAADVALRVARERDLVERTVAAVGRAAEQQLVRRAGLEREAAETGRDAGRRSEVADRVRAAERRGQHRDLRARGRAEQQREHRGDESDPTHRKPDPSGGARLRQADPGPSARGNHSSLAP